MCGEHPGFNYIDVHALVSLGWTANSVRRAGGDVNCHLIDFISVA